MISKNAAPAIDQKRAFDVDNQRMMTRTLERQKYWKDAMLRFIKPWFAFAAASMVCLPLVVHAEPWPWPTREWVMTTPEEVGMDSRSLAALVQLGLTTDMDSLVVTRQGKIVAEAYYAPFQSTMRHTLKSGTKGIVATLTGIAIQQRKLDTLDRSVVDFFPRQDIANMDERKKEITVQNLLDMQSGLQWTEPLSGGVPVTTAREMDRSADWVQFILDRPMAHAPGTEFNYNSGNAHLLSALLARRTGMRTADFAAQYLFKPLGITDYDWNVDPQGNSTGADGLSLRPRDMAKIGYLYLRGGQWDGQQLLPPKWVEKVSTAKISMGLAGPTDFRYRDLWWSIPSRKVYMAPGVNQQIILVMPQEELVVAITGRSRNYRFETLLELLVQAVKTEGRLPADPKGYELLLQRQREASTRSGSRL